MNRFGKRLLSLLLCVALTAGLLPGTALATATDVIAVTTVENLRAKRAGSYILSDDIALPVDWKPIEKFSGTLDGNGHTITLTGAPLFESIAESGRVINLLLAGEVKSDNIVGVLANTSAGEVANCYSSAKLSAPKSADFGNFAGGFIGKVTKGSITNCLNTGEFSEVVTDNVGKIVGYLAPGSTLSYCYWTNTDMPNNAQAILSDARGENCKWQEDTFVKSSEMLDLLNAQKGDGLAWDYGATGGYPVPGGSAGVGVVNKAALQAAIEAAEDKLKDGNTYTAETLATLNTTLEAAKAAYESEYATQNEVDAKTDALNVAIGGLRVDLSGSTQRDALEAAIAIAAATQRNELQIPSTWETFRKALATAQEANVNPISTQEKIDQATLALTTAQAGLTLWTANVVPESGTVKSITTVEQLGNMGDSAAYYRLDADLTVIGPLNELKGTFDGNGHVITLSGGALFKSIAETATIQNLGLVGTINGGVGASFVEGHCAGRILNSYSKVNIKGREIAVGLVGILSGGYINNTYFSGTLATVVENEKIIAGLVNNYKAGAIHNSYWLEAQSSVAVNEGKYFSNTSVAMDISDFQSDSFREGLNQNRGGGKEWGQFTDGLPYHGENKDFNPDQGNGTYAHEVYFQPVDEKDSPIGESRRLNQNGVILTLGELSKEKNGGLLTMPDYSGYTIWKTDNYVIGVDNTGGPNKRLLYALGTGMATITVIETDANYDYDAENPVILAEFPVKVTKGEIEDVKYYIGDGEVFHNGTKTINGYEWIPFRVKVKYDNSTDYQEVSAQATTVFAENNKLVSTSDRSFRFNEPGQSKLSVSALGRTISVNVTSSYVPVSAIRPGPNQTRPEPNSPEARYKDAEGNYILHERNPNSASLRDFNKLQDTPNVIVEPANASYGQHWTLKSSDPSVAQFVDSLVVRVVPYKAGTVIFTATSKDKRLAPQVSDTSTASFVYLNPVESVTAQSSHITVVENKAQALPLVFTGPKSVEGYHVSEAGMNWTYTSTDGGAVEIFRGAECDFVRNDKEYYVSNDKYQIRGLQAGTVTAVGTPVDETRKAAPITLTITVSGGEAEVPADIPTQINRGLSTGISYLRHVQGARPFAYNSEWEIFTLLRSGVTLDAAVLEPYFTSIANTFANPKGDLLKPTTLARVALALTAAGQDASNFRGVNFFALLGENALMTTGSNEPMWTLIALDSKGYDSMGSWSREALVAELLRYQNPQTGGFGLTDNVTTGADITAMSIQALAPYYGKQSAVTAAVDKALDHLRAEQKWDGGFANNCESSVQVLVALCMLGLDPLDENNGFVKGVNRNLLMSIMSYRVETEPYGFIHIAGTLPQPMTTDQAVYGLSAYARFLDGRPGIYDMSDLTAAGVLESQLSRVNTLREEDYTPESWAVLSGAKAAAEAALAKETATDEELTAAGVALSAAVNALVKKPAQPDTPGQPGEPEKPEEKPLNVSIRVVGDVLHEEEAHGKYQTWISTEEYTMPKGSTVYDLLELALMSNGMGFEESQYSYIGSIQAPDVLGGYWLSEFDNGPGSGWKYLVNGTYPGVGLRSKPLKDGDAVVWRYVDDYTNEFDNTDKWQEAPDVAPVAPPAEAEKPDGENIEQLKPEISVDRTGEAKVELSAKDVEHATEDIVLTPVIQGDARKVSVTLPKETLSAIASELGITLKTEIADLKLSANALGELSRGAGESLSISAETMKDENGRPDGRVRLEL